MSDRQPTAGLAAVVTVVVSVVLWFALVPHSDTDNADPRVGAYWWIMIGAALVLGFAFGPGWRRVVLLAAALTLPQVLLAVWTAPRGDGDGLWVLWMPLLLVFGAFLLLPIGLGAWLRGRVAPAPTPPSTPSP